MRPLLCVLFLLISLMAESTTFAQRIRFRSFRSRPKISTNIPDNRTFRPRVGAVGRMGRAGNRALNKEDDQRSDQAIQRTAAGYGVAIFVVFLLFSGLGFAGILGLVFYLFVIRPALKPKPRSHFDRYGPRSFGH